MILLYLTYVYGENQVLFAKITARILVLWLDTSSEAQVVQM